MEHFGAFCMLFSPRRVPAVKERKQSLRRTGRIIIKCPLRLDPPANLLEQKLVLEGCTVKTVPQHAADRSVIT